MKGYESKRYNVEETTIIVHCHIGPKDKTIDPRLLEAYLTWIIIVTKIEKCEHTPSASYIFIVH